MFAKAIEGANDSTKFAKQQNVLNLLIHASDLSNQSRPFHIARLWSELLIEGEFFVQGDKEKVLNLPVSFLCDRETVNLPKSQVGFIAGLILPMFKIIGTAIPDVAYMADGCQKSMEEWKKLEEAK